MRRRPGSPLRARRVSRRGARTGSTSWSALSLSRSVEAPPAGGAPRRPQLLDGPAQQALGPGLRPPSCSKQARRGRATRLPGASQQERSEQPQPPREAPARPQPLNGPVQQALGPSCGPRWAASRPGGVGALALVGRRAASVDGAGRAVAASGMPGRDRWAPMLRGSVGRVAVRAAPSASSGGAVLATRPRGGRHRRRSRVRSRTCGLNPRQAA